MTASIQEHRAVATVSYRNATLDDRAAITALLEAAHLPSREVEPFIRGFVVAEQDGMVVACGGIEVHADTAVLRSVAVDESVQGSGIGRRLAFKLIAEAIGRGALDIYLFTADAWQFWQKVGFVEITLDDWRQPARRSWQYAYVSANQEFVRSFNLRTMWMPGRPMNV